MALAIRFPEGKLMMAPPHKKMSQSAWYQNRVPASAERILWKRSSKVNV